MEYREVIRSKSKILCIALLASIVLRGIVNAVFTGIQSVIGLTVAGLVLTVILMLLVQKINPLVMMYLMVLLLTGISVACMVAFPCTTNYLMFFLAIFMIVLYEDIRPIGIQCILSAVCMLVFYYRYRQELADTWTPDAVAMCVVYIVSGMFVFGALCKITGKQFRNLQSINEESICARERAEQLLSEISKSIGVLDSISGKINSSMGAMEEISHQIASETDNVAKRTTDQVASTEEIREMVQDGVRQIQDVSGASVLMEETSHATSNRVFGGGDMVRALKGKMFELNDKMDRIANSMQELREENEKIGQILATLDEITSQTGLLSLNASIEAARAGEQGRGFAVVATEIRNLSDNSARFTEQIHTILDGIKDKTVMVCNDVYSGQDSVGKCVEHVEQVDISFKSISENTEGVLTQAGEIMNRSQNLEGLLGNTFKDVESISDNVESTSKAMEEIAAGIAKLNSNVDTVVSGYNDINRIMSSLISVSKQ